MMYIVVLYIYIYIHMCMHLSVCVPVCNCMYVVLCVNAYDSLPSQGLYWKMTNWRLQLAAGEYILKRTPVQQHL